MGLLIYLGTAATIALSGNTPTRAQEMDVGWEGEPAWVRVLADQSQTILLPCGHEPKRVKVQWAPPCPLCRPYEIEASYSAGQAACVAHGNPDMNGDGSVDFLDVVQMAGELVAGVGTDGDLNGDGVVDFIDARIFAPLVGGMVQ